MKFKVNRSELLSGLHLCLAAVETRSTMPFAGLVEVQVGKSSLMLYSTNTDIGIKSRISVTESDGEAKFAVGASRLHDWLNNSPEGDVSLEYGQRLAIRIGRSSCSLNTADPSLPTFATPTDLVAEVHGSVLSRALHSVASVVPSFDGDRFSLGGVLLSFTEGKLQSSACDGRRVSTLSSDIEYTGAKRDILVSKKAATTLASLSHDAGSDPVKIYADKSLLFTLGGKAVFARGISGTYPSLEKAFPAEDLQTVLTVDKKELLGVLSRVLALSDKDSRALIVKLSEGLLTIASNDKDGGASDYVEIQSKTGRPEVAVKINGAWLLDAVRNSSSESVELRISDHNKPVEVRDTAKFRYVLAPMDLPKSEQV